MYTVRLSVGMYFTSSDSGLEGTGAAPATLCLAAVIPASAAASTDWLDLAAWAAAVAALCTTSCRVGVLLPSRMALSWAIDATLIWIPPRYSRSTPRTEISSSPLIPQRDGH